MSMNKLFHLLNETNHSCPDFKGQNYRASFHTRSSAKGPRKKTYKAHLDGDGPRKGEHAVVKVFRDAPGTECMCDLEITKHVLARKFARKFNKMVTESTDRIHFTLPLKSTVDKFGMGTYLVRHSRHMDKQEWVLIEENLVHESDCKFEVFLRKNGDRLQKDPTSLDAFLHFSYFESGQKFVMCGFQGIHTDEEGYKLSTPCLHSKEKRWGLPDKGRSGIKAAFEKHKCNNLCYSWPKPSDHLSVDVELVSSENETDEAGSSCDEATRVESSMAFSSRSTPVSRDNSLTCAVLVSPPQDEQEGGQEKQKESQENLENGKDSMESLEDGKDSQENLENGKDSQQNLENGKDSQQNLENGKDSQESMGNIIEQLQIKGN